MKVNASIVINKPASDVWLVLRNFIGLTTWSNAVTQARITNGKASDQIGAIRELEVEGGAVFTETLVAISDEQKCLTYDIVEGPIPVRDYLATMQVLPVTESDHSYVCWSAEFDTPDDQVTAMRGVVGEQICAAGLRALKAYMESD
jgi:hypothetical protein